MTPTHCTHFLCGYRSLADRPDCPQCAARFVQAHRLGRSCSDLYDYEVNRANEARARQP